MRILYYMQAIKYGKYSMIYHDFGKTGFRISALGFGAMRLPIPENADREATADLGDAVELLRHGIRSGINYIDTAYFYCNGRSELAVGLALEDGWRDRVALSTKLPVGDVKKPDDARRILEDQLRKLRTDHIDFYHFHGIGRNAFDNIIRPLKLIELMEKCKAEGLIRHLSFSFHDPNPHTMIALLDTGAFSSVLCQYNLLDRSNLAGIRHARELGVGVVVMGPVGGGRLAFKGGVFEDALGGRLSTPELAVRFVLSTPGVCCALSGMGDAGMVDGNVRVASSDTRLTEAELAAVDRVAADCDKLKSLYCTGCNYCTPVCPAKVNIPRCFEALIYDRVYNLARTAEQRYRAIPGNDKERNASACVGCGACEKKCPQHIPIRQRLRECVERFR